MRTTLHGPYVWIVEIRSDAGWFNLPITASFHRRSAEKKRKDLLLLYPCTKYRVVKYVREMDRS